MHATSLWHLMMHALVKAHCAEAPCMRTRSNIVRQTRFASILVDHARLRDLSLFAIKPGEQGQRSLLEALAAQLREGATRKLSSAFDHTLVAWDHSRPAARAVADALPMLRAANSERRRRYPRRFLPVRGRSRRPGHGSEIPCTIVMNEPGRKSTSGVKYPDHNKHLDRCDCPCGAGNDRADDEAER
jgi:hypothetical protein